MIRAAIYCRVSSDHQAEDGTSLDTQEAAIRAYCDQHGYTIIAAQRDVWTGADLRGRPGLARLRELVRGGGLDVLVAYAVDRLSRHQTHLGVLLEECEHHGVRLEFVTEKLEDTAVGRFLLAARAFAAELEREKIKERTQRGRLARVASGKLLPGRRPLYGYRWTEDRTGYVVEESEAAVVRRIFHDAASGRTLTSIADRLSREGIPSPGGAAVWSPTRVRKLLKHPAYAGHGYALRWQRAPGGGRGAMQIRPPAAWVKLPEGLIPPIVPVALWERVQGQLLLNQQRAARRNRHPEAYLLRGGFARCGACGGTMTGTTNNGAPSYRCARYARSRLLCSRGSDVPVRAVDGPVWSLVLALITDPATMAAALAIGDTEVGDRVAELTASLRAVERRMEQAAGQLVDLPEVAAAALRRRITALDQQRQRLLAELEQEQERQAATERRRLDAAELEQLRDDLLRLISAGEDVTYQAKRAILEALGVRVLISRDWRPPYRAEVRLGGRVLRL